MATQPECPARSEGMTTGEKETMTSAVERPKSGSLGVTPAGSRPGANLSDDGSPGAAGRGVT